MSKSIKPKFIIDVVLSDKKFTDNKKNVLVTKTDITALKKRMAFILSLLSDISLQISVKFCDKTEITHVNYLYRDKDKATDVLSFPTPFAMRTMGIERRNGSFISGMFLGDILICLPVCHEQAKKYKNTFAAETERMLIHGILHLIGFDHERSLSAQKIQEQLEKSLCIELNKSHKRAAWIKTLKYKGSKE